MSIENPVFDEQQEMHKALQILAEEAESSRKAIVVATEEEAEITPTIVQEEEAPYVSDDEVRLLRPPARLLKGLLPSEISARSHDWTIHVIGNRINESENSREGTNLFTLHRPHLSLASDAIKGVGLAGIIIAGIYGIGILKSHLDNTVLLKSIKTPTNIPLVIKPVSIPSVTKTLEILGVTLEPTPAPTPTERPTSTITPTQTPDIFVSQIMQIATNNEATLSALDKNNYSAPTPKAAK